ncbi:hypothetical protein CASFOL_012899 [Castilleja foliolosa]|uniref:Uncharacterized protein n=1 Tax=Castilleja foliolosa TaxID=1961234 RepID=A0ABD3DM76_9LAMI
MSDQELSFFQDPQIEDSICRSMHHLSTVSHHHHHPNAAAYGSPAKQTTAGFMNSTKRQAPLSPSSFQEPVSKRATLNFPSSPSTTTAAAATEGLTGDDSHLFGFTKLPLPHPFPAASVTSPLRRTVSEPIQFANAINPPAPPQQSSGFSMPPNPVLRQPLQESPNRIAVRQDSFPFPNAAPTIHRTVSDPNPVANLQVLATIGSPPPLPRPSPARNVPRSPSCGESPSTKRLKRMKERLREMSQWWNQVVSEGDEEETESENYFNDNIQKEDSENGMENPSQKINQIPKDESENEMQNASQEAVWVEKNGECLVIHFKCPCGTGYQILLSGNDCYYKLTNF